MDNNIDIIYSNYISDDICEQFSSELMEFYQVHGKERLINVDYTFNEHAFLFIHTIPFRIKSELNGNDIIDLYMGRNIDYNLIKSETIVNSIFCTSNISPIKLFLEKYDETCFWDAFGLTRKEALHYQQLFHNEEKGLIGLLENKRIISELRKEILKRQIKKAYIIDNIVLPLLSFIIHPSKKKVFNLVISFCRMTSDKFPETVNKFKDAPLLLDLSKISIRKVILRLIRKGLFSQELLYYLFYATYNIKNLDSTFKILHQMLNNREVDIETFRLLLIVDKFGFDIYKYYVDFCERNGYECCVCIKKEEFISVSTPHLTTCCKKYFPSLNEQEAQEKVIECYKTLFNNLKIEKYLDEDCRLSDFLWAFGLLDKQPHSYKRIAFHSKAPRGHIQGTAAFLQLLVQLGYSPEEIHQMQKEPSIINEIFDLNVTRKNKPGKRDKEDLQKIVLNSGLPIVKDVED